MSIAKFITAENDGCVWTPPLNIFGRTLSPTQFFVLCECVTTSVFPFMFIFHFLSANFMFDSHLSDATISLQAYL